MSVHRSELNPHPLRACCCRGIRLFIVKSLDLQVHHLALIGIIKRLTIFFSLCALTVDVSCQIWGAGGGSLSVGGVEPADLFPGSDVRDAVSGVEDNLCSFASIHF